MPTIKKMYLILREDLAFKYIQGGHALLQFALEHPDLTVDHNNQHLICLSVFNGLALKEKTQELESIGFGTRMAKFVEPDLESELPTAIAIYENGDGYVSRELRDLKLATK